MNLSYLKTTIKTNKINNEKGIISGILFIKIITKCLYLGFTLLSLKESSIFSTNNNYSACRGKNEELYFNLGTKKEKFITYSF